MDLWNDQLMFLSLDQVNVSKLWLSTHIHTHRDWHLFFRYFVYFHEVDWTKLKRLFLFRGQRREKWFCFCLISENLVRVSNQNISIKKYKDDCLNTIKSASGSASWCFQCKRRLRAAGVSVEPATRRCCCWSCFWIFWVGSWIDLMHHICAAVLHNNGLIRPPCWPFRTFHPHVDGPEPQTRL